MICRLRTAYLLLLAAALILTAISLLFPPTFNGITLTAVICCITAAVCFARMTDLTDQPERNNS
jgi:hypothetical protein